MIKRLIFALGLLLAACFAQAQIAVPALQGHVTDLSGALSPEAKQDLETRLTAIETQKGSQVTILILPTTQPEDLAAFGIRVADAWKIGRSKVDDGVILLVALQDRKLRLEVGRGLEGAIPDAIAKRIIIDDISPLFKQGDFHGGLAAGVSRIAGLIGAEALPPPVSARRTQARQQPEIGSLGIILILLLIVVLPRVLGSRNGVFSTSSRRGRIGAGTLGGLGGLGGWGGGGGGNGGSSWGGGGGGFGGGGASGDW